jgi:DNA-binding LacI/PurR family transcriptional regulator
VAPKRPTSADVAALAGVSRTTVSFVLNDRADVMISPGTRSRVHDAADRLGYLPHASARHLAAGRSHVLGLVLRQTPEQVASDALLGETLHGLGDAARSAGYRVLVEPLALGEGTFRELLVSQRADGLVVSGPRVDDVDLARLVDDGYPIVLQGSLSGLDVPSIDVDNIAGASDAVDHLVALGHQRIVCITNASLAYTSAAERLAGFRASLARAGIAVDEEMIAPAKFDAGSGHRAMAGLLARISGPPPTAIFVASDVVALGVIGALRGAGLKVPRDISVVGFDDIPLAAYFDPPLTTVRLPARELGQAVGRTLIDRIAGRVVPTRTLLPTELVVRGSTAPPTGRRGGPSP